MSATIAIALARALDTRAAASVAGVGRVAASVGEAASWVAPRMSVPPNKTSEASRPTPSEELASGESTIDVQKFVLGTLDMVAYARAKTDALVEVSADRVTVP